VKGSQHIP